MLLIPNFLFAETSLSTSADTLQKSSNVQRILSAGRVSDVLLMSLAPEKLVGISMENTPEQVKKYFPLQIQHIANIGRLAGRGSTAPLEKIMSVRPDIIIDVGNVSKVYLDTADKISKQTHISYVLIDGRFDQTTFQIEETAKLIGATERGEKLAKLAHQIMERTHKIGQKQTALRVYFGRSADGLETGLAGSIHAEVLDWIGAINVAAIAGEKMMTRVSMEQILRWDPDVIITHDKNFYAGLIAKAPLWQSVSAVKNQKIYLIPAEPFGWLDQPPGINRLLGAVWLAHKLYPEQLNKQEAGILIKEYFNIFYQYNLSEQELAYFGI
ncbi:iron ABC transporter substrate-binding protein [Cricetibacter osteomyelitidis]|uniref:iron ABC transporter substrate-binding protein n=1 Tax=Cricetibacter osteomyelitidis TaxID=1521931 RepID=UPI0014049D3C|nr:iron ABC transporter substrate-binding protein [Cricetibacter osteomyelitidis]